MSISTAIGLASLLVQASVAALYAFLLARLNRSYNRPHLRLWIPALWLHAVQLALMAGAFLLVGTHPANHWARLLLTCGHTITAYWYVALMGLGARRLLPGRSVQPWAVLGALLGLALVASFLFSNEPGPSAHRYFMRVGVREGVEAAAYFYAALAVARARTWADGLGRTLVSIAFFVRALLGLHGFAYASYILLGGKHMTYLVHLSAVDILTLALMGTGMVIALLDAVRREQLTAVRQQERAELSLEQNRERVETLLGYAGDAVFIVDDLGKVLDANPAACSLTGFGRGDISGRFLGRLVSNGPTHWSRESTGEGFVISRKGVSTRVDYLTVPHVVPEGHVAVLRVTE